MLPEPITTPEQLDTLPAATVLIVHGPVDGELVTAAIQSIDGYWMAPGSTSGFDVAVYLAHGMDVFVVWKPGQPTGGEVKA